MSISYYNCWFFLKIDQSLFRLTFLKISLIHWNGGSSTPLINRSMPNVTSLHPVKCEFHLLSQTEPREPGKRCFKKFVTSENNIRWTKPYEHFFEPSTLFEKHKNKSCIWALYKNTENKKYINGEQKANIKEATVRI
jgi:hypothetical protein